MYMLLFNFIFGSNFISLCFKLIIINYHTPKQREIKFKPRIKLNHNIYFNNSNLISFNLNWKEKLFQGAYKKLQPFLKVSLRTTFDFQGPHNVYQE